MSRKRWMQRSGAAIALSAVSMAAWQGAVRAQSVVVVQSTNQTGTSTSKDQNTGTVVRRTITTTNRASQAASNGVGQGIPPFHIPSAAMPMPAAPAWMTPKLPGGASTGTVIVNPPYCDYNYGWPSTTVIINNTPVIYPVNDPINGYGYASTPPLATVVETLPNGRTRMTTSEIDTGCAFPGYAAYDQSGQTVLSPFAVYSGCTPYLYRRYVVFSTPTVCADSSVGLTPIDPWNGYDAAGSVTASSRSLRSALDDVAAYWQEGRIAGLRRRTAPDVSVAVFRGERFAYSLHRTDFLALASDALQDVHTVCSDLRMSAVAVMA